MDGLAFLEQHRPALEALCRQYGVARLYAFGSVVKGGFGPDSDVDLLVQSGKGAPAPCPGPREG